MIFGRLNIGLLCGSLLLLLPSIVLGDSGNGQSILKNLSEGCSSHSVSEDSLKGESLALKELAERGYSLPHLQYPASWDFSATEKLWPRQLATEIKKVIVYHIAIFGVDDEASKVLLKGFPIKPLTTDEIPGGSFLSKSNNQMVDGLFTLSEQSDPEIFLSQAVLKDSFQAIVTLRHELWHYLLDRDRSESDLADWYESERREANREIKTILAIRHFYLDHFGVTEHSKSALDLLDHRVQGAMLRESNYQLHLDALEISTKLAQFAHSKEFEDTEIYFNTFLSNNKLTLTLEDQQEFHANLTKLSTLLTQHPNNPLTKLTIQSTTNATKAIHRTTTYHNNTRYWENKKIRKKIRK